MRHSIAALSLFCLGLHGLPAQNVPGGFVVETLIAAGLGAPNDFCWLPDGRILIANRNGLVSLHTTGPVTNIGTVPNVETGSERALLGIDADPGFATNGHVYVWYSSTADAFMHLDRFTCTGDLSSPTSSNLSLVASSRRAILANVPDSAFNHNGGSCRFGPDGMLYQSIGDDASSCSAQTLTGQRGVLLRMDVSSLAAGGSTTPPSFSSLDPGDNPLSANSDFSQLVIAHGLRNPVRMTIDSATNNVYIGDVGQNSREEYSEYVYQAGNLQLVNFGWPWREGIQSYSSCGGSAPSGMVNPIADISQSSGWRSAMGGPRYRNQGGQFDFGPGYEGNAFWGDYFSGAIRRIENNGGSWSPAPAVPGQPNGNDWMNGIVGLTSFDVGPDGAIYFIHHPATYATSGGFLKRVRPLGPINTISVVSGGSQFGPAGEAFPQPLILQLSDPQGSPLAGGQVNLAITASGSLSTTNPLIANGSGLVQTTVTSGPNGGPVTITATNPAGDPGGTSISMFGRRVNIVSTPTLLLFTVINGSLQPNTQVPMILLASQPGIAPLPSPIGPICTNPDSPLTFVLEDSIGVFGFASLSGTGAIGVPGLTKVYNLSAPLTGITLQFQAVGLDPVLGPFRTNCELKTL